MKTEVKQTHTPTPWEAHEGQDYNHVYGGDHDHSGNPIAEVAKFEDAAYIVKCVNAHEGLVEALNAFRHVIGFTHTDTDADQNAVVLALELAEKALAQAEGK